MLPGWPHAIVRFREGTLVHEHIYRDQASVLKQLGLLSDAKSPGGRHARRKVREPSRPQRPLVCKQAVCLEARFAKSASRDPNETE
jgi:carboxymethylenebutenolidase